MNLVTISVLAACLLPAVDVTNPTPVFLEDAERLYNSEEISDSSRDDPEIHAAFSSLELEKLYDAIEDDLTLTDSEPTALFRTRARNNTHSNAVALQRFHRLFDVNDDDDDDYVMLTSPSRRFQQLVTDEDGSGSGSGDDTTIIIEPTTAATEDPITADYITSPSAVENPTTEQTTSSSTALNPTTEQSTSENPSTKPGTSHSPSTEPGISENPSTEPGTSENPSIEPRTSENPSTEPSTSENPSTEPDTTVSSTPLPSPSASSTALPSPSTSSTALPSPSTSSTALPSSTTTTPGTPPPTITPVGQPPTGGGGQEPNFGVYDIDLTLAYNDPAGVDPSDIENDLEEELKVIYALSEDLGYADLEVMGTDPRDSVARKRSRLQSAPKAQQYVVSYTVSYLQETVLVNGNPDEIFEFIKNQAFPAIVENVTVVEVDEEYMNDTATRQLVLEQKELEEKVAEPCTSDADSLNCDVKYYCKYDVNVNSSDWCLPICYYQSRDSSTVCCEGRDPLCTVEHEMCAITAPGTQPGQYVCSCDAGYTYVGSSCYDNDYVIAVFCSVAGVIILCLIVAVVVLAVRRRKPSSSSSSSAADADDARLHQYESDADVDDGAAGFTNAALEYYQRDDVNVVNDAARTPVTSTQKPVISTLQSFNSPQLFYRHDSRGPDRAWWETFNASRRSDTSSRESRNSAIQVHGVTTSSRADDDDVDRDIVESDAYKHFSPRLNVVDTEKDYFENRPQIRCITRL